MGNEVSLLVCLSNLYSRVKQTHDAHTWPRRIKPTDLPALTGPLSPNERLLATEHLHDRDLIAPEAFAEGVY